MLLKRILIGVLCAVIAGGSVYYGTQYKFFDKPLTEKEQVKFEEKIALPDGFILAAAANTSEHIRNSMESVQSGVNSSSYAIELNVTFDEDGTPYLSEGSAYITEQSVRLETVFKKYAKYKYLHFILQIKNFPENNTLGEVALNCNCSDRILLTGITKEGLASGSYSLFPTAVDLDASHTNLNRSEECFELVMEYVSMGANMLLVTPDQITDALVENSSGSGLLPIAVKNVSSEYDMYKALSIRPSMIITNNPDKLYEIMTTGDYMGFQR